ncbi:hypothetical protein [Agarivorans sp. DSG3-1]|uniref:hypothetical protein n=1 Tax=Agarivorans sp. DSG3-1 TaxID=3342249 RepID=UPI00398F0A0E
MKISPKHPFIYITPLLLVTIALCIKDATASNVDTCGVVSQIVLSKKALFVNLDGHYPNHRLTAVSFRFMPSDAKRLDKYVNTRVCISGHVSYYKGKPSIALNSYDQIQYPQ